jgi:aminoglycoside phosphotransferase (APT) family kinase protein
MPGIPPAPTHEQFERIAKAIDNDANVISTKKLTGGISCRMDVLEYKSPNVGNVKVVTRQYWENENPANDNRLWSEPTVLMALTANSVLAPTVIVDFTIASEILGRPSVVISYLDGGPNLTPKSPHDWAIQLANAIADVHAVPITPELDTKLESAYSSIDGWMNAPEPPQQFAKHALGTELWHAMRDIWPTIDTSPRKLLHGDYWPGNTVWNGETLLAIVDWEEPVIGDPMMDVGYFLSDAAYFDIDIEETFLNSYMLASGNRIIDLRFWKMAAAARAMPDVGPWAQGYAELSIRTMTADEIRGAHHDFTKSLLK